MNTWITGDRFDETRLPPQTDFYDKLNIQNILMKITNTHKKYGIYST